MMAFTNIFDNGFPLDTQQAKLLGDDIRKFKVDVQERMAAISGLDASKPNFASDTQPTKWNGMLFFATDTGKIYQFQSGTTWTDITSLIVGSAIFQKYFATPDDAFGKNQAGNVGNKATIPANSLITGNIIRVSGFAAATSEGDTGTTQLALAFGGTATTLAYVPETGAMGIAIWAEYWIIDASTPATTLFRFTASGAWDPGSGADGTVYTGGAFSDLSIDSTADIDVKFQTVAPHVKFSTKMLAVAII